MTACELRTPTSAHPGPVIVSARRAVLDVLHNPRVYSSASGSRLAPRRPLAPVNLDPPLHTAWRTALDPLFAPARINSLCPTITRVAADLIEGFADADEIDFAAQFSVPFPTQVLMVLLGLPLEDLPWLTDLTQGVVQPHRAIGKPRDDAEALDYQGVMSDWAYDYFQEAIDKRAQQPADDVLTELLAIKVDGTCADSDQLLEVCFTLLTEGVAPMSAALDCVFALLAEHRELRQQVIANPRRALEELLRWVTPVSFVSRTATTDTVLQGCPIMAGQRVVARLSDANSDPTEFEDAGTLRPCREVNRHMAFGAGIHRCLGSHLARAQILVALQEWHRRIPEYSVERPSELAFARRVRTVDRFPMRLSDAR